MSKKLGSSNRFQKRVMFSTSRNHPRKLKIILEPRAKLGSFFRMKSSYELAMERMGGEDKPLTDEQKERIAEVGAKYKAKIAERKIFLEKAIQDALAQEKTEEADELRSQLVQETAKLETKSEEEKDKIRES